MSPNPTAGLPITAESLEHTLNLAMQKLQTGDRLAAEETVHASVVQTAAQAGTDSPLYARALFHEASVLASLGDWSRATVACRAAATIHAKDAPSQRDRLTYLMNLGDMLTRLGELDEAEQILRVSLDARQQFYGPDHPGYAFGLSALAELLLARGLAPEALELVDRAVAINQKVGHDKLAQDLGLRAFILKAARGVEATAFPNWDALSQPLRDRLVRYCLGRAQAVETAAAATLAQAVLQEVRERLEPTADREPNVFLNTLIGIANVARLTGDHEARIEASQRVVRSCEQRGDIRYLVQAEQGLAHALSEAGRREEAEAAYAKALQAARQVGDEALAANVLRNHAIFLDEQGQRSRAEILHRQSVARAAVSGDPIMHGRALGAYGIFLHHAGDRAQAGHLLDQAAELLPPSDPDAFYIHNHLEALRRGQTCSCSDGDQAVAVLVKQLVERHLPQGLLKGVHIKRADNGTPDIGVELTRKPTDAEAEQLHRVVSQALAELRQQQRKAGYSR